MPRKGPVPPDKIKHGTLAGYTAGKCRCQWCTMANRAYHGADMAKRSGRIVSHVGPDRVDTRVTLDVTADEAELWSSRAEEQGLSRNAYVRRGMNEVIAVERANERMEAEEDRRRERIMALARGG